MRTGKAGKLLSAASEEHYICVSLTLMRNYKRIGLTTNANRRCVIGVSSLRHTSLQVIDCGNVTDSAFSVCSKSGMVALSVGCRTFD